VCRDLLNTGGDSSIGEVRRERGIAAEVDGVPSSRSLRERKDVRISADEPRDSPFDDVEAELSSGEFARGVPPVDVFPLMPGTHVAFLGAPTGWFGPAHPAPLRLLFFSLSGEGEVAASDGELRHFSRGGILLVEDTRGKGYSSRVGGETCGMAAIVQLAS
jgi:hypothetical protein